MPKTSAGLLMYRVRNGEPEFLLAHPGGPFSEKKDAGVWTIPKGEVEEGEELLAAAKREFQEELGIATEGPFLELAPVRQKSGKIVRAWAFEGDCDPATIRSNTFEWVSKSGKKYEFPEVDRAEFFPMDEARERIIPEQIPLLEELMQKLGRKERVG